MHVCIVKNSRIPVRNYGGTDRVVWWLGKELSHRGHKVSYIAAKGSECPFASVIEYTNEVDINRLIPTDADIVHLNQQVNSIVEKPCLQTIHGNANMRTALDVNSVFVSKDHAARHGSDVFVHNGIDPDDYGRTQINRKENYAHFLGKAAWRVKNVSGALSVARKAGIPLYVLGGNRFNFKMGIRLTLDRSARFFASVGGENKNELLRRSSALVFPVRWHEPFGLAIIESLYFGCPVFGTPYGSLPELINNDVGFLSTKSDELGYALCHANEFDRDRCHQYVMDNFTLNQMTTQYLKLYEKVLSGAKLSHCAPRVKKLQVEKFLPFQY